MRLTPYRSRVDRRPEGAGVERSSTSSAPLPRMELPKPLTVPHGVTRRPFPRYPAGARIGFALLLLVLLASPAAATWSIVAVDPRTREVGSAGASCTPYVAGIVALAPGRGVIVAQALSNSAARRRGVQLLADGGSPTAIVAAIGDPAFDDTYQEQQYGVAALDFFDRPAAFTGQKTPAEAGHMLAPGVSVQGNILTGRDVLTATMSAFEQSAGRPLAERLLTALEAGAVRGGDRRCGAQTAHSAYLVVARPDDSPRRPTVRHIVPGQDEGGPNPVHLLRAAFDAQRQR